MELLKDDETHLLILWSNALDLKEEVVKKIKDNFILRRVFNVHWNKKDFNSNLRVFYAHSQKHLKPDAYEKLIANKIAHCGDDNFCLIVFDDPNPVYEDRSTSDGFRPVNANVFDMKQEMRKLTGGGHKIHASDNTFESNKDLTLLLGANLNDFDVQYPGGLEDEIEHNHDCIGVTGYKDISQLFYVLNNTIDYCVMRNFECLPDSYTLEGHGDIDLLVENLNYIVHLTNAESVYPDLDYRVHYVIRIGEEQIPFDFRYLGDDYYDLKWELSLIKNREIFNDVIYVPDAENYFYSLLYHAFIHKREVKEDYHERLQKLGQAVGLSYHKDLTELELRNMLDGFMVKHGYSYTIPVDETVFYNQLFLDGNNRELSAYGKKIATRQVRYEKRIFFSQVFQKDAVFTKVGSKEIIESEIKFLERLSSSSYVPKIIHHESFEDYALVQLEQIVEENFKAVFHDLKFWNKENIDLFFEDALAILQLLIKENVLHRDIRPGNIIITKENSKYRLRLIDFGWAVDIAKRENSISPRGLGAKFRYGQGEFSDAFSMGKVLNLYFGEIPFYKNCIDELLKITPEDYNAQEELSRKLKQLKVQLENTNFGIKDHLALVYYRNDFLRKTKKYVSLFLK